MTLELASETNPIDIAWAAYDDAMLRLQHAYDSHAVTPDARAARRALAIEALNRWNTFISLFEATQDPRPAA